MVELLTEFQGIIGAVLGVVATLITTHLLRNIGRVKVEILDLDITLSKFDQAWGQGEEVKHISLAHYIEINFKLKCYNSSEIPRMLHDIELICYSNSKEILFRGVLDDLDTFKSSSISIRVDSLYILNIPPKEGLVKPVRIMFTDTDSEKNMKNIKSIKLKYIDKRNKNKILATF